MNWKTYVEKKNAKTYVLPQGWDSRETIAEQLDCTPDKVDDHLRPALKSGEVIKQSFKVWDANQKRLVFVIAYQEAKKVTPKSEFDLERARKLKAEGKTWAEVGAVFDLSEGQVRGLLRRAKVA